MATVDVTVSGGVIFEWRSTANATPTTVTIASIATPVWVKLTRAGNSFSGFYSTNGSTWIQIGSTQTINMSSTALAGLSVSSHDNFALNQATFTNVAVLPAGWSDVDINSPCTSASATEDGSNSTWTLSAGGTNNTGTSDQFNFASQSLTGDGSIMAQVTSQTAASDAHHAPHRHHCRLQFANVDLTSTSSIAFQCMLQAASATTSCRSDRLRRRPPVAEANLSPATALPGFDQRDGLTWTQIGTTQFISMRSTALAGLAVKALTTTT